MEHSVSGMSSVGVGAGRSDADSVFGFPSPWGNERTTTNTGGTGGGTTHGGTDGRTVETRNID